MNQDILQGQWQELRGRVKETWGKLTDDDLEIIDGQRQELLGRIQKAYGKTRAQAEREIRRFEDAFGRARRRGPR
jgi:uncharacterized protein YjbJ (UPF0337 family)